MKRVQRLKKSLLIRSMFLKYFLSTVRTPIAHGMALLLNGDGLTESIQNFEVTGFVLNLGKELFVEWDGHRHVVCDLLRKKIIRVDDSMLYTSKTVLDLNDEGERWEGDALNGKPCGWGVLYDSENRMAYEGFRVGDVNVCYGTRYYSDIGVIEYKGELFFGQRWGRGVQYDRNGKVVYDGEWVNDEQMKRRIEWKEENQLLHNRIEELVVCSECMQRTWAHLVLSSFVCLRKLKVGDDCFSNVRGVELVGLKKLERVVIGENCFANMDYLYEIDPNSHFYLKNCERVRELKIGRYSFRDYSVCEIENVDRLKVIKIGELILWSHNFRRASLELKSKFQEMK